MAYQKQTFINNYTVLTAGHLEHIEEGIYSNSVDKLDASQLPTAVNNALAQAKASGEFKGDPGATPKLSVGTVTTLSAGSNATASITGTSTNPVLNLGIPKGADGSGGGSGGAGADGGYYVPSLDNSGNLSWTASKTGMPSVQTKNIKGADGKTPVRGTDYWTTADIAEIKSYVDNAILGGAW